MIAALGKVHYNVKTAMSEVIKMPARLGKGCHPDFLDEEFKITGKQLLLIMFLVFVFFTLCFLCKGPTYGVL